MINKILIIVIIFLFVGCWKDIDDTNDNCTSNCTTISGKILTEDGSVPVSGLDFQMDWIIKSELGGTYRKISKFKTDKNGNFEINFHATDQELYWGGGYTIKYLDSDNNFVDLKDNEEDYPVIGVINMRIRDTIIYKTLYLPKRSFVRIRILNTDIETSCSLYYKYGEISSNPFYHSGGWIYSNNQSEKVIEASGNQINYLMVTKRLNNEIVSINDSIFAPVGDTIVYNIK